MTSTKTLLESAAGRRRRDGLLLIAAVATLVGLESLAADGWQSSRVAVGSDGWLVYPPDAEGNRIPDFSHAGYRGGGVALPEVAVVISLAPVEGDNTARIQAALDQVGALPLLGDGHRGAVRLEAGVFEVSGTLRLNKSGVVLTGVGNGVDPVTNTILRRTGTSTTAVIIAGGGVNDNFRSEIPGTRSNVTTPRVPVGAHSLEVADPSLYGVGDAVIVYHPSTNAWLDAVNRGDTNGDVLWQTGEIDIRYHRYVTAIQGSTLVLDAPVFNTLDRALAQTVIYRYNDAAVVREVGVENLFIEIVTSGPESEDHASNALQFIQAENCWAWRVAANHFVHAGVQFGPAVTRGTALECRAVEPHSIVTGARRYNFGTERAQLILFEDCYASYARHAYVANGTSLDAGNVFLDCTDDHSLASSEGHRRWSHGLLYDGLQTVNPGTSIILGLYNRGDYGTGHGWAAAHSVAWRCDVRGRRVIVQKPPTAQNYAIGCFGTVNGNGPFAQPAGFIEGTGQAGLYPRSLYRAQLAERFPDQGPPRIVMPPASQTLAAGMIAAFSVAAEGAGPFSYQWFFTGADLPGETGPRLVLDSVGAAYAGSYEVRITGAEGTVTSAVGTLTVTPPGAARLVNLSSRGYAGQETGPMVAGFVASGGTGEVLVRGVGPTLGLEPFNLSGVMADPYLILYDENSEPLLSNDNWPASLASVMDRLGAFPLPGASLDAAFLADIPPWPRTAVVFGNSDGDLVLTEVYDAADGPGLARLVNLSTRAHAGVGEAVLVVGFVIEGDGLVQVLIRGVGPTLALPPFELSDALVDPLLRLHTAGVEAPLDENDRWEEGMPEAVALAAERTGAFRLSSGSLDAALLATLSSGVYTAIVSGRDSGVGAALVEIYAVGL